MMTPDRFDSIIGHHLPCELLRSSIKKDRIAPAYLFVGRSGIGKTLTAQAFVEVLLGRSLTNHPDVLWLEPTYQEKGKLITLSEAKTSGTSYKGKAQIRVEQIRSIGEFLAHPPLLAKRSVVVMTDAHTMSETSANALLKTLEEPGQATIILIVNQQANLLPTIVSRCQVILFAPLNHQQVMEILQKTDWNDLPDWVTDLAQGSPGIAIECWELFQQIPQDLLASLSSLPLTIVEALTAAKRIAQELDLNTQLWLIDYLQRQIWQQGNSIQLMQNLEQAKSYLLGFVQPRLVWEVTLGSKI